MLDILSKYKDNNHFFLTADTDLERVCNAPTDKSGIYLIYALKDGYVELVYIGISGKVTKDGSLFIRKGGMKDRMINGHQFGKIPRKISWKRQIKIENIEALDIYWYVTHNDKFTDCPRILENKLLKKHFEIFGRLPKWNKEF
jgi:hypothetical protein